MESLASGSKMKQVAIDGPVSGGDWGLDWWVQVVLRRLAPLVYKTLSFVRLRPHSVCSSWSLRCRHPSRAGLPSLLRCSSRSPSRPRPPIALRISFFSVQITPATTFVDVSCDLPYSHVVAMDTGSNILDPFDVGEVRCDESYRLVRKAEESSRCGRHSCDRPRS